MPYRSTPHYCVQWLTVKTHIERVGHLEDPDIDRRVILKWIFEKWDRGMGWIDLAQDRESDVLL